MLLQLHRKQPLSQPTPLPLGSPIYLFNKRPVLHRDFTEDSLQAAIDELQNRLQAKGYLPNNLTGRFDLETERAVRDFQTKNNLFVDGVVGPLTWMCLCYPKLAHQRSQQTAPEITTAFRLSPQGLCNTTPEKTPEKRRDSLWTAPC